MQFILNANTKIVSDIDAPAVKNAGAILRRDIGKRFCASEEQRGDIILRFMEERVIPKGELFAEEVLLTEEAFLINVAENMTIYSGDELGFVYALLYISKEFLGIKPFWFWMDQKIDRTDKIAVDYGYYKPTKPIIKYRGWFVNDEVLIMKWKIDGEEELPWRMVFEALLRCGGNMVIPGTDKNSKKYRKLASDMGLWITHHHAEPLGAEMFVRAYPDEEPDYTKSPELFQKLWEESVKEQAGMKVIWTLGFRGQGDCPFWSNDKSGRFDTPEKRGALISHIIELQQNIVKRYVENPVFCTNLYGEIMELYEEGQIHFSDDIIKIGADNGYGKMVTRRRDNHTIRISSLPKEPEKHGGIYYHVSFYDLQAANHITMLPNSVDFVEQELSKCIGKNMTDFWIVNCSNVRPHTYFLDAIRKRWYGEAVSDEIHSSQFADEYFDGDREIAGLYRDYHKAMLAYGKEEDEHAGEQFYTENVRLFVHAIINGMTEGTQALKWLVGMPPLGAQIEQYVNLCRKNLEAVSEFYDRCKAVKDSGELFGATLCLHTSIHYFCSLGVIAFGDGYREYVSGNYKKAFMLFGYSAEYFGRAAAGLKGAEYGVWQGFYANDCFADIKYTAYMLKKLMGYVREKGDNARHDEWYRDAVYAKEDRKVYTLLVNDNHMTDWELFEAFKKKGEH